MLFGDCSENVDGKPVGMWIIDNDDLHIRFDNTCNLFDVPAQSVQSGNNQCNLSLTASVQRLLQTGTILSR
nr:hypothetical protein [Siphonobacter aquaeclarae]